MTPSETSVWVVVCSRMGSMPQVVGGFPTLLDAEGWIRVHWRQYPLWAFSPARLQDDPGTPREWQSHYLREIVR